VSTGVGSGIICLTSFSSPTPKNPTRRKNFGDISYISQVIADFVSKFVAMATRVIKDLNAISY